MLDDTRSGQFLQRSKTAMAVTAALASLAALSGCGSSSHSASAAASSSSLSGTVAVGVALTEGRVRVLDASGTEVAADITVAEDGSYTVPALSGTGPYRIEACGYAGPNYECLYSVVQGPGQANVTPLTSATMLLASGSSPETAMSGAATGLSPSQIDAAQTQLRNGLGSLLAGNDLSSGFDFITGSLSAGSRNGYDRLLDSVSVHLGVDDNAFVQIAPRLGSGNLYLQQNTATVGSISADSGASSVPLNGLNALFERMTSAIATPTACAASSTGMAAQMASNARLAFDSNTLSGPTQVGTALCGLIEESGLSGAHFLNPTLSRCHTEGASPICQVSFAIQATDGSVENVSAGMGAVLEGNTWKFLGSFYPVQIDASARAQRRLNVTNNTVSYDRAIAVGIQPVAGLQCAKVSQPTTVAGVSTPVAYFKLYDSNAQNLSLWTNSQQGNLRSLDPNVGYLRSGDDTWIMLPEGTEGDNVIRNFFRGGRTLTVSMYSDTACTTALNIDGQSEFEVDIDGLPPVWSAMPTLSWPELTSATISSMQSLTLGASESVDFTAAWTFPNGRSGVDEATFCTSGQCGDNEPARVAHRQTSPALPSTTLSLQNSSTPVAASGFKMLALSGSGAGGLRIQSNFIACTTGSECQ